MSIENNNQNYLFWKEQNNNQLVSYEEFQDYFESNEEQAAPIVASLAALYYLDNQITEGNKYLRIALLIDFPYHKNFLALDPLLQTFPEIAELIDLYKPE